MSANFIALRYLIIQNSLCLNSLISCVFSYIVECLYFQSIVLFQILNYYNHTWIFAFTTLIALPTSSQPENLLAVQLPLRVPNGWLWPYSLSVNHVPLLNFFSWHSIIIQCIEDILSYSSIRSGYTIQPFHSAVLWNLIPPCLYSCFTIMLHAGI